MPPDGSGVGGAAPELSSSGLRIVDVRIAGAGADHPAPGGAAEISIRCAAAAPIDGVRCVVELGSRGWFPVAVIGGPATAIPAGESELRCRVASLLSKPSRRVVPVTIDFLGFEIPDEFVLGFGMDLDGRYRELPDVVVYDAAIERAFSAQTAATGISA